MILTGYSWDQPQRSQHAEGSKGFNIKTSWFPSVAVHRWMATFSVSLLLFGQKLQDNTEESVRRERGASPETVINTSSSEMILNETLCWFGSIIFQSNAGSDGMKASSSC